MLKEMLRREPSGVSQLDAQQRLPLHVAAANCSEFAARLVDCLVKAFSGGCLARDKTGRLPIHYAASNSGPSAHIMAAMLVEAYPECCEWPTVPLSAVHIAAAPMRVRGFPHQGETTGRSPAGPSRTALDCESATDTDVRVPILTSGSFAIIQVPEGGGSIMLPNVEDRATVVVTVRPQDRVAPLLVAAPHGDTIYDAVDDLIMHDNFVMSAPVDLLLQFSCSIQGGGGGAVECDETARARVPHGACA